MHNTTPLALTPPPSDAGELAFLNAWKSGVCLVGIPSWFGINEIAELDRYHHIQHLQPRIATIEKKIREIPLSKAALLAAMVALFNPAEGVKLADKLDLRGLGHLFLALPEPHRQALSAMLLSYRGW